MFGLQGGLGWILGRERDCLSLKDDDDVRLCMSWFRKGCLYGLPFACEMGTNVGSCDFFFGFEIVCFVAGLGEERLGELQEFGGKRTW